MLVSNSDSNERKIGSSIEKRDISKKKGPLCSSMYLTSLSENLIPTKPNMNSEGCEQAIATASLADMPTLFRDNVSSFCSCIITATMSLVLIFVQSFSIKVRMGNTGPCRNKKRIEVMGCPLRSKYSSLLEQARLLCKMAIDLTFTSTISIYLKEKCINPGEWDIMLFRCSSVIYWMFHSSRWRKVHKQLLSEILLHRLETRDRDVTISLTENRLNIPSSSSSDSAVVHK